MTPMTVVSPARRSMGSGTAAMRTAVPAMRTQRKRPMQDHTTRTRSHDPVRARSGRVGRNRSRSLGSASDAPSASREPAPRSAPGPARSAFHASAAQSARRPPLHTEGGTRGIGSVAATGGCPAGPTNTAALDAHTTRAAATGTRSKAHGEGGDAWARLKCAAVGHRRPQTACADDKELCGGDVRTSIGNAGGQPDAGQPSDDPPLRFDARGRGNPRHATAPPSDSTKIRGEWSHSRIFAIGWNFLWK